MKGLRQLHKNGAECPEVRKRRECAGFGQSLRLHIICVVIFFLALAVLIDKSLRAACVTQAL
jgi:hypothetical protein